MKIKPQWIALAIVAVAIIGWFAYGWLTAPTMVGRWVWPMPYNRGVAEIELWPDHRGKATISDNWNRSTVHTLKWDLDGEIFTVGEPSTSEGSIPMTKFKVQFKQGKTTDRWIVLTSVDDPSLTTEWNRAHE